MEAVIENLTTEQESKLKESINKYIKVDIKDKKCFHFYDKEDTWNLAPDTPFHLTISYERTDNKYIAISNIERIIYLVEISNNIKTGMFDSDDMFFNLENITILLKTGIRLLTTRLSKLSANFVNEKIGKYKFRLSRHIESIETNKGIQPRSLITTRTLNPINIEKNKNHFDIFYRNEDNKVIQSGIEHLKKGFEANDKLKSTHFLDDAILHYINALINDEPDGDKVEVQKNNIYITEKWDKFVKNSGIFQARDKHSLWVELSTGKFSRYRFQYQDKKEKKIYTMDINYCSIHSVKYSDSNKYSGLKNIDVKPEYVIIAVHQVVYKSLTNLLLPKDKRIKTAGYIPWISKSEGILKYFLKEFCNYEEVKRKYHKSYSLFLKYLQGQTDGKIRMSMKYEDICRLVYKEAWEGINLEYKKQKAKDFVLFMTKYILWLKQQGYTLCLLTDYYSSAEEITLYFDSDKNMLKKS